MKVENIFQKLKYKGSRVFFYFGKIICKLNYFFSDIYLAYIPDRYSFNLKEYNKLSFSFFKNELYKKWTNKNYKNNSGDLARLFFLIQVFELLIKDSIKGNVMEIGVYRGNSAAILSSTISIVNILSAGKGAGSSLEHE